MFQNLDDPIALRPSTTEERAATMRRGDQLRRRRRAVQAGAITALTAAALGLATAVAGPALRSAPQPATSNPAVPTPNFVSSDFVVPFALTLPTWATQVRPTVARTHRLVSWEQSPCTSDCAAGSDRKLRFLAPVAIVAPGASRATPIPDYPGYLKYLQALENDGVIATSNKSTTTVAGRPATLLTVTTATTAEGAIGCELAASRPEACWGFVSGMRLRLAVVQVGPTPLLAWSRTNDPTAEGQDADSDFARILSRMQLSPGQPSPTAPPVDATTPLQGTWRTSYTTAQARQVLAAAGLGSTASTVLKGIDPVSTWELRIDGERYGLYRVGADGTILAEDGMTYTYDGTTLTGDPQNLNGTRTSYKITVTGSAMRWTLMSDESPPFAPGVPDEAIQRVQYTTGLWTKVS
jgi:hypothetical protein